MRNAIWTVGGTLVVGLLAGTYLSGLAGGQAVTWTPAGAAWLFGPGMTVKVLGIPTHDQMIEVHDTTPLTVPTGKAFVLTGVVMLSTSDIELRINGVTKVNLGGLGSIGFHPSPTGIVATAAQQVTVTSSAGNNYAVGYLADA